MTFNKRILERSPASKHRGRVKGFGKFLQITKMVWSFVRFGRQKTVDGAALSRALCNLEIEPFTDNSVENYRNARLLELFPKLMEAGIIEHWTPSFQVQSIVYPDAFKHTTKFSVFVEKIKPQVPSAQFLIEEVKMGHVSVIRLFFVAHGSKKFCLECCEELEELNYILSKSHL